MLQGDETNRKAHLGSVVDAVDKSIYVEALTLVIKRIHFVDKFVRSGKT